jgi:hypothetical protein
MLPKYKKPDYSVADTPCPPGWTHSGPYKGSFICSNNCNGVFSYMNADEGGYNSNDPTDYCSSATVYNPLEKFSSNQSGFTPSKKKCNKNQVEVDKSLTNGLSPKVQKFLLTQTSLATTKVECFYADTNLLQLGSLEADDLVGGDSRNPNNLGQAYVESCNELICPAGFTSKNNNCQIWDEAIAKSN